MLERPKRLDLSKLDKTTLDYIVKLEHTTEELNSNPIMEMYVALKTQLSHIAQIIKANMILDISDKDDKSFDRVLKLSTDSRKIVENMKYLEGLINPEDAKEIEPDEESAESFARKRRVN